MLCLKQGKLIEFDALPASLIAEATNLIDSYLNRTNKSEEPRLIHLCGIPGSGKSFYAQNYIESQPRFALVQFDTIMENLSGYQSELKNTGSCTAFTRWELPARSVGYHLLQALLENERNVLFDHSAAFRNHVDLITKAKNWGYTVEMHYISCSLKTAKKRIREREITTQRHTPEHLLQERYDLLEALIPFYKKTVHTFIEMQSPE